MCFWSCCGLCCKGVNMEENILTVNGKPFAILRLLPSQDAGGDHVTDVDFEEVK